MRRERESLFLPEPSDTEAERAWANEGGARRIVDPTTGGEKDQKDVQLHALPWEALGPLGRVYSHGAVKYADYNFRKGYAWSLSFDAMLRHLFAFWSGEDIDPESGLPHISHAAWHALTLSLFSEANKGTDDRPRERKE